MDPEVIGGDERGNSTCPLSCCVNMAFHFSESACSDRQRHKHKSCPVLLDIALRIRLVCDVGDYLVVKR